MMVFSHSSLAASCLVLYFRPLMLTQAALMERCGDCFCVPGSNETCPTDETGIVDSLDIATNCVLDSFQLTNDPDFLKLVSSDGSGGDCYPFADSVGVLDRAPQTELPSCVIPSADAIGESAVCAYKYNAADTTCVGREYQVLTYDSAEDATADGAFVTHTGACGVCSSAHDLWVRIREFTVLESNSVFCATSYVLSNSDDRFEKMIQCYEEMGFTSPCATLWAHFGAVNSISCANFCFPNSEGVTTLNLDPPTCEFAPCLECSQTPQAEFDILSGRTLQNSGITERIIRPCSAFSRVEHDYCVGTTQVGSCEASSPTPAPQADNGTNGSGGSVAMPILFGTLLSMTTVVMMHR